MKKLEDLPKRVDYKVPDGYFDNLPGRIQARISSGHERVGVFNVRLALRFAVPIVALLSLGVYWYTQSNQSITGELSKIDHDQLAWFMDDPEMTGEEIAENVSWSDEDLDALELAVFEALDVSGEGLDVVIDDLDLENL